MSFIQRLTRRRLVWGSCLFPLLLLVCLFQNCSGGFSASKLSTDSASQSSINGSAPGGSGSGGQGTVVIPTNPNMTSAIQTSVTSAGMYPLSACTSPQWTNGLSTSGVILPPTVPQVVSTNDIVGLNLQNLGQAPIQNRIFSFGQFFAIGKVRAQDQLVGRTTSGVLQVQMDPIALWPDGSVKHAALSLLASLPANTTMPVLISKASTSDPAFGKTPLDLSKTVPPLIVTLNFTSGAYSGQKIVDLGSALASSLASNSDYWQKGPLLTQARVDVPIAGGSLHITADVTARADGTYLADVQFNNDLATIQNADPSMQSSPPVAPPLQYTAEISLKGTVVRMSSVTQDLYTDWHTVVDTLGELAVNVQHDVGYLERAGAILPYDLTTGVNSSVLASYQKMASSVGFRAPLAVNGVTAYMPTTGGRPDIGYTTQYNTVWLLTQDICAAAVSLAQGDTAGAVPWNLKLAASGAAQPSRWLTPGEDQSFWIGDYRYTNTLASSRSTRVFDADTAHQPNLSYVPYLMTGVRWHLDRLNAQAAFAMVASWTTYRCIGGYPCDIIVNGQDQLRAQAWTMREIEEAALIGNPASLEQKYFAKVAADNWQYIQSKQASFAAIAGEAAGYLIAPYGTAGALPEWQQDYFTGMATLAATLGDTGARQFVRWQTGWLSGRFLASGFNPHDGCNYNLMISPANSSSNYTTWAQIEAATVAAGLSNGSGWTQSAGDYCSLARAALGSALTLSPGDAALTNALNWLNNSSGAPYIDLNYFRNDPTFNVVPLKF